MTLASGWRNVWIVGGQGPPFSHTYFPFSIQLLPRNSQKSERVCATSLFAAHANPPDTCRSLGGEYLATGCCPMPGVLYLGHQPVVGADKKAVPLCGITKYLRPMWGFFPSS